MGLHTMRQVAHSAHRHVKHAANQVRGAATRAAPVVDTAVRIARPVYSAARPLLQASGHGAGVARTDAALSAYDFLRAAVK